MANVRRLSDLSEVPGIGEARARKLQNAGYEKAGDLEDMSTNEIAETIGNPHAAAEIKEGLEFPDPRTGLSRAREEAQGKPGAIAKVVRIDGKQVPKVLEKVDERNLPGATVEVHLG